jgi:hypothetical protein
VNLTSIGDPKRTTTTTTSPKGLPAGRALTFLAIEFNSSCRGALHSGNPRLSISALVRRSRSFEVPNFTQPPSPPRAVCYFCRDLSLLETHRTSLLETHRTSLVYHFSLTLTLFPPLSDFSVQVVFQPRHTPFKRPKIYRSSRLFPSVIPALFQYHLRLLLCLPLPPVRFIASGGIL